MNEIKSEKVLALISDFNDEPLVHYGVPGMRWGVRTRSRGGSSSSGRTNRKKSLAEKLLKPDSEDSKAARKLQKIKLEKLSNEELKTLTKRLDLEKKYKDLNPTDVKRGYNLAKGALAVAGTATAIYAVKDSALVKDVAKVVSAKKAKRVAKKVVTGT